MNQLKEMLEAYRNGERGLPTYDELAALAYPVDASTVLTDERAAFEAWAFPMFKDGFDEKGFYSDPLTWTAWMGWSTRSKVAAQAAQAAQAGE